MGKRGRPAKGKFDDLKDIDQEFMSAVESKSDEEVHAMIAQVALNDAALTAAKKLDEDLKEKKEAAKFANEPYSKGAKMNKLRIAYARQVLNLRGKESGDSGIEGNPESGEVIDE